MMQVDRNSFCDNVVLDSVNMAFRDEDSFLDHIYDEKQIWLNFHDDDFIYYAKMHID